jgi:hypothetical protein
MTRELVDIEYKILASRAYELYKRDWCSIREWTYDEVCKAEKDDMEYNGQMFVCKAEFEGAEFLDREYMKYLLNDEDFWCYEKLMEEMEYQ